MTEQEVVSAPGNENNNDGEKKCTDRGHAAVKLTVLCMVMYACSYLCRKSFDSNVNEIMAFYGEPKAAVGLISTCFFVTYAIGQVFHGIMCKYYKPGPVMFCMAAAISALNVIMGIIPKSGFTFLKYVWALNGLLSASLWSLLILTLHSCTANKYRHFVIVACTIPVTAGMIAGIVDGFCYVGSAISGYGIGAISDGANGWSIVFALFLSVATACAVLAFILTFVEGKKSAGQASKNAGDSAAEDIPSEPDEKDE